MSVPARLVLLLLWCVAGSAARSLAQWDEAAREFASRATVLLCERTGDGSPCECPPEDFGPLDERRARDVFEGTWVVQRQTAIPGVTGTLRCPFFDFSGSFGTYAFRAGSPYDSVNTMPQVNVPFRFERRGDYGDVAFAVLDPDTVGGFLPSGPIPQDDDVDEEGRDDDAEGDDEQEDEDEDEDSGGGGGALDIIGSVLQALVPVLLEPVTRGASEGSGSGGAGGTSYLSTGRLWAVAAGNDTGRRDDPQWAILTSGEPTTLVQARGRGPPDRGCAMGSPPSWDADKGVQLMGEWYVTRDRNPSDETLAEMQEAAHALGLLPSAVPEVGNFGCGIDFP